MLHRCKIFLTVLAALAAAIMSSCGRGGYDESVHPLFIKAKNFKDDDKFEAAARTFEEYLKVNHDSAKAHYELAVLYGDHLDDPLRAIYHYKCYMEMTPEGSEERQNIQSWLDGAERKYFERNRSRFADTDAMLKEIAVLKEREKENLARIETLNKENYYLKNKVDGNFLPEISDGASGTEASVGGTKLPVSAQTSAQKAAPPPKKYKVQFNDTLMRLSRKFYGDTKYYKIIYEANKDSLKSVSDLQPGQDLIIPDISEVKKMEKKPEQQ